MESNLLSPQEQLTRQPNNLIQSSQLTDSDLSSEPRSQSDLLSDVNLNKISIEQAFERCGGFGVFQFMSAFMNTIANAAAMFFFNAFAFLEVEPQFKCLLSGPYGQEWVYGTPTNTLEAEYCENPEICEINWDSKLSINNLLVQLNFMCAPKWKLGMVGAVFLIGIVVGCSFVTKLGDQYGRRPVYLFGLILNLVLVSTVVFAKSVILCYFCLFMLGISITARYYVGYTYNLEFQPKKAQVFVSTIQFTSESIVYLLDIAYFVYISNNWKYLQIPNIILTFAGVVFVYFMPESPRFLVASKQFDKARGVFAMIAKFNGIKRADCQSFIFEKEAELLEIPIGVDEQVEPTKKVSWRVIWAEPLLRQNLWASCLLYSEASFNFYLLTFYLKYFPGNIFENSTYFACSDLLAFILTGIFLNFTSMKTTIRAGSIIGAFGGLLYLFLSKKVDLVPFMICMSRVGQSMIFNTTVISVNRLFPTLYVATAYGVVNFCAHLFACLAPFVAEIKNPYPFICFVILIGVAIFTSFFLTEVGDNKITKEEENKIKLGVDENSVVDENSLLSASTKVSSETSNGVKKFEDSEWVASDED